MTIATTIITTHSSPRFFASHLQNFLIAGCDTAAQSLAWMFLELWRHPGYVSKIHQELAEMLGTGVEQRNMAYDDIKAMPFLQACYYEAIRLWPSVPKNIKLVVADDVIVPGDAATIDDLQRVIVKKGETVCWSDWVMARMPEVWGPDCQIFKPERFLTQSSTPGGQSKFKTYSQWQFHAFNAGPRVCLGKSLATYEGMCVAAAVLGKYNVIYDDEKLKTDFPVFTDSVTLPCTPYHVRFHARRG